MGHGPHPRPARQPALSDQYTSDLNSVILKSNSRHSTTEGLLCGGCPHYTTINRKIDEFDLECVMTNASLFPWQAFVRGGRQMRSYRRDELLSLWNKPNDEARSISSAVSHYRFVLTDEDRGRRAQTTCQTRGCTPRSWGSHPRAAARRGSEIDGQ